MTKYLVKRPWHGVSKGDIIETDKLHPALLPNVEVFEERKLEVATPGSTEGNTEGSTEGSTEGKDQRQAPKEAPKAKTKGK